jgi:hypothetical protein
MDFLPYMMSVVNQAGDTGMQETLLKPFLLKETIKKIMGMKSLSITFLMKYTLYMFALLRIYPIRLNIYVLSHIKH